MMILKQRTWIHKNELLESIIVTDSGKTKFYSHTYLVRDSSRGWIPYVKWDNWEGQPHADKYDGSGALTEQKSCGEQTTDDVLKLVKIFRKNLLAMELSKL